MKEYYLLQLNHTYGSGSYYNLPFPYTMFSNILELVTNTLDNIDNYFNGLDDTIIPTDADYKIYGSFPVVGYINNDKMYDAITDREIKYAPIELGSSSLTYRIKQEIDSESIEHLLTLLDESAIKRYNDELDRVANYYRNKMEEDKYYLVRPQTNRVDSYPAIAKYINDELVDIISKRRLFILPYNAASSHLYRHYKEEITKRQAEVCSLNVLESGINDYLRNISLAEKYANIKYNNYKTENTKTKTRIKETMSKNCQKY